jgi:hypothetical protein
MRKGLIAAGMRAARSGTITTLEKIRTAFEDAGIVQQQRGRNRGAAAGWR